MKQVTFTGEPSFSMGKKEERIKAEVGMEVAIRYPTNSHSYAFGKIIKITPKGFIDVDWNSYYNDVKNVYRFDKSGVKNVYRFDKSGVHYSGGYVESSPFRRLYLVDAEDARKDQKLYSLKVAAVNSLQAATLLEHPRVTWELESLLKAVEELEDKVIAAKTAILAYAAMEKANEK